MKNKEELIKKIVDFSKLEKDWDGKGASKLSQSVIDDTLKFLKIFPDDLVLPNSYVSPNNEVILSWESENGILDLYFYGIDEYMFYYHLFKESTFIGDICTLSEFPSFLRNYIESIK